MNDNQSEARWSVSRLGLSRGDVAFLGLLSAFIVLQLFRFPFTPFYFEGDHLLPISNAMRLLDGEVMYRDFFHFKPPGTELYYAALFCVFGIKVWILNATIFLLALAQLVIIFAFSNRSLPSAYRFLPGLVYFIVGFRLFGIDGSDRLFSVIFVLGAAWVVASNRGPKRLLIAGALCGFASFFVQTRGLLGVGAIGLFVLWENWSENFKFRSVLRYWLIAGSSFLFVVAATQFYFAWTGGFDNYFFSVVTFLKDYYGSDTLSNTFAYFSDIPDLNSHVATYGAAAGGFRFARVAAPTLFFYFLVPLVYLLYFVFRKLRSVDRVTDRCLMLLSIMGTVLYLGASAPTAFRLYHISIPAVIVGVWLLSQIAKRPLVPGVLTAGLAALGFLYCVQRQTVEHRQLDLPAGTVAFLNPASAEKYIWLAGQMTPGEYIYEAEHPTYYFPLHLRNPTPFYLIRDNNYTPPFQVERLMDSLRVKPPRFIVWEGSWSKVPEARKPGDNLAPLWDMIQRNYALTNEFREPGEFTVNSERDIEFWERKQEPSGVDNPHP